MYYPAAGVGYSEVTIKSFGAVNKEAYTDDIDNPLNNQSSSGKTVSYFFTAKDYPILTDHTNLELGNSILTLEVVWVGNNNNSVLLLLVISKTTVGLFHPSTVPKSWRFLSIFTYFWAVAISVKNKKHN